MRKFYSFLLTALLACVSMAANAVNVILNIDDPSRVNVTVNNTTQLEDLVAGDNPITVEEYQQIQIKAKSDAFITEIVKSMEGAEDVKEYVTNMSEFNIYASSYNEGAKWTVTTADANAVRDGVCRIWIDDPAKVRVLRSGTYTDIELKEGWNDNVRYIKASELPLNISAKDYDDVLYQVKMNGEVVSPEGTSWRITPPEDGAEIEIFANFPDDLYFPVKFTYANDESKEFITSVRVNGDEVANYNDEDFKVKAGSKVEISGNTSDYKLNSFTVNGNTIYYFYSSYSFNATNETTIFVDAHKYGTFKATLNVDNADNIIVYKGNSYDNNIITLQSGENTIEVSETNTQIQIKAASGCYITSVTANGNNYSLDYNNAYTIAITEGMVINVVSGAIERNDKAMVYIDDRSAATQYFNFQRNDRSAINIATGYNEINFYDGDNPFGLSWYGAKYANVYKNNEVIEPMYQGSTTYELNLVDGDVVKIFLASTPEMLSAEITAGESVDASKVAVTMDRITTVTDWAKKHNVLPGTEISLKVATDYNVKVNGTAITADENGTYTVVVNTNTTISIDKTTGINSINAEENVNAGVYNMQGVRVAEGGNMNSLPAGVYIVNGKKIVKK